MDPQILEMFTRYQGDQSVRAVHLESQQSRLVASMLEPVNQIITSQFIVLDKNETDVKPVKIRYVWPSELDLMARLAGLKPVYHWDDWRQSPFSNNSSKHIAIDGHA